MTILIPEIENSSIFPEGVLQDLFAWAERHAICLYCDTPVRYEEDEETPAEPFVGFEDLVPYGTFGELRASLRANTPIFVRDPEMAEHRFSEG